MMVLHRGPQGCSKSMLRDCKVEGDIKSSAEMQLPSMWQPARTARS